jgi:hypothetical protein
LPCYNAIHMIDLPLTEHCIQYIILDNSAMAVCQNYRYHIQIPLQNMTFTIHENILWTILVTARMWCQSWCETKICVYTASNRVSAIINSGSSRIDREMTLARNIWLVSAVNKFNISVKPDSEFSNQTTQYTDLIVPDYIIEKLQLVNNKL